MIASYPALDGLRVAVVNWRDLGHPRAGGAESYAWNLAVALRDAGASVEFLTARARGQAGRETVDDIEVSRAGDGATYYPAALARLWRRRRRLDLVLDAATGLPTFAPLVVRSGTPVVVIVHHVHQDQFAQYLPAPLAGMARLLERLSARVYARCTAVAVSASTRTEMVGRLRWPGAIEVIHNGADHPVVPVLPEEKAPGRVVVLGRLVAHKRVDAVVEAFAEVAEERSAHGRPIHLDIIGAGPEAVRLAALVHDRGLQDRVTIHGFLTPSAKSALLRSATLQVCASDAEGWGQVVIEAAAHGVPTLARDVPGLRSSIVDGETGWLVPEGPGALVDRLALGLRRALAHLDDVDDAALLVGRTRAHAAQFTWPAMQEAARRLVGAEVARRRVLVPLPAIAHHRGTGAPDLVHER